MSATIYAYILLDANGRPLQETLRWALWEVYAIRDAKPAPEQWSVARFFLTPTPVHRNGRVRAVPSTEEARDA